MCLRIPSKKKKKKKKTVEGNQNHNRVQYSINFFRVEILREIGDRLATVCSIQSVNILVNNGR